MNSNSTSWLFRLPHGYLVTILSEWLDIVDVARLDTAVTNHSYRLQFLDDLVTMRSTTVDGHLFDGGFRYQFFHPTTRTGAIFYGEGILGDEYWEDHIMSVDQLQWLSRRRIHVEDMELAFIDPSVISHLRFPSLRKLRIDTATGCGSVELSVVELIKSSPALTQLVVIGYFGDSSYDGDDSRVGGSEKGFGMLLRSLVQYCPLLEGFTLDSPFKFHVDDLLYLFRHAKALRDVSFTAGAFRGMQEDVDDDGNDDGCNVNVFAEFGHLFTSIILSTDGEYLHHSIEIAKVPRKRFCKIISTCSRLKQLKFRENSNNSNCLEHVAQSCPLIEEITANSWSDLALQQLSRNCKNLRRLAIKPDKVLRYRTNLVQTNPHSLEMLNQIVSLQELNLPSCSLSDNHIAAISSIPLQKLTLVPFVNNEQVFAGLGFESFVGAPISRSLQKIKVTVPDGAAGKLALVRALAACQQLRKNWLLTRPIDNAMLAVLSNGCPLLERIRMLGDELTFDGLLPFIASKTYLQRLISLVIFRGQISSAPLRMWHTPENEDIILLRSRFPLIEIETRWTRPDGYLVDSNNSNDVDSFSSNDVDSISSND